MARPIEAINRELKQAKDQCSNWAVRVQELTEERERVLAKVMEPI